MAQKVFTQVTIFDFALMEGRGLINKARVIGHELEKGISREQGALATAGAIVEVMSDPLEQYHNFPPPGAFRIERG